MTALADSTVIQATFYAILFVAFVAVQLNTGTQKPRRIKP